MSDTPTRVPLRPSGGGGGGGGGSVNVPRVQLPSSASADPRYVGGASSPAGMLGEGVSKLTGEIANNVVRNEQFRALDLAAQEAVQRDAEGKLVVPDDEGGIFERDIDRKLRMVRMNSYASAYVLDQQQTVIQLRADNPTPEGFAAAANDWRKSVVDQAPASIKPMVAERADKLVEQHRLNIAERALQSQQAFAAEQGEQVIKQLLTDGQTLHAAGRGAEAATGPDAEALIKIGTLRTSGIINGTRAAQLARQVTTINPIQAGIVGEVGRSTVAAGWISEALLQGPQHARWNPAWAQLTTDERGQLAQATQHMVSVYRASLDWGRSQEQHAARLEDARLRTQDAVYADIIARGGELTAQQQAARTKGATRLVEIFRATGVGRGLDFINPEARTPDDQARVELSRTMVDGAIASLRQTAVTHPEAGEWLSGTLQRTANLPPEMQAKLLAAGAQQFHQQAAALKSDESEAMRQQNVGLFYANQQHAARYPDGNYPAAVVQEMRANEAQIRANGVKLGTIPAGTTEDGDTTRGKVAANAALNAQHIANNDRIAAHLANIDQAVSGQYRALKTSIAGFPQEFQRAATAEFVTDTQSRLTREREEQTRADNIFRTKAESELDAIRKASRGREMNDAERARVEELTGAVVARAERAGAQVPIDMRRFAETRDAEARRGATAEQALNFEMARAMGTAGMLPAGREMLADAERVTAGWPVEDRAKYYNDLNDNLAASVEAAQKRNAAVASVHDAINGGEKVTAPDAMQQAAMKEWVQLQVENGVPYPVAMEKALNAGFVPQWMITQMVGSVAAGGGALLETIQLHEKLSSSGDPRTRSLYSKSVPDDLRLSLEGQPELVANLNPATQTGMLVLKSIQDDMKSRMAGKGGNVAEILKSLGGSEVEQQAKLRTMATAVWGPSGLDESGIPRERIIPYDQLPESARAYIEKTALYLTRHTGTIERGLKAAIPMFDDAFVWVTNHMDPSTGVLAVPTGADLPNFTGSSEVDKVVSSALTGYQKVLQWVQTPPGQYVERRSTIAGYPAVSSDGRGIFGSVSSMIGSDTRPTMDWLKTHLPDLMATKGAAPEVVQALRGELPARYRPIPGQAGKFEVWYPSGGMWLPAQVMGPDGKPTARSIVIDAPAEADKITEATRVRRIEAERSYRAQRGGGYPVGGAPRGYQPVPIQ